MDDIFDFKYGDAAFQKTVDGTSGDDSLVGTHGDDVINGFEGNDDLIGKRGDDVLIGGPGDDVINGNRGDDTAVFEGSSTEYVVTKLGRVNYRVERIDAEGNVVETDLIIAVEALFFEGDQVLRYLDGRNSPITTNEDAAATDEDTQLDIAASDLTANDIDGDGDVLTVTGTSATSANGIAISFDGTTISYNPAGAYDGLAEGETTTDTFTYTVEDGNGDVQEETVTITITGVNDAPVIDAPEAVSIDENTNAVAVIGASDADSTGLTFSISGGADAASFAIDPNSGALSFILTPDAEAPADTDADNVYDVDISVTDDFGATASASIAVTVDNVFEGRINEFHYDNGGTDTGEFVEIRTVAGEDVSGTLVEFYNGSNGTVYRTASLEGLSPASSDGEFDYYVIDLPSNGIQNGSPDGIALSDNGTLVEFLSYEGVFTGVGGAADGVESTDIGVSENGGTEIGFSLQRNEEGLFEEAREETKGGENVPPAPDARINEFHYDNASSDVGEFIEIRVEAGGDVSLLGVELYNGSNGSVYNTLSFDGLTPTTDGEFDYYVFDLPSNGLQNGAPDGLALTYNGDVVEFLSYEGSFTAAEGAANGLTSTDIGVFEPGDTPIGFSLQRLEGDTWDMARENTSGFTNILPEPLDARINEFHYDNDGSDVGEFIEIRVEAGGDVSGLIVELYNGSNGTSYNDFRVADFTPTTDGTYDYYVINLPSNGLQNGSPDGIALSDNGEILEFLSYEGSFTAIGGNADGVTSTDIGVSEPGSTPIGFSLQRLDGDNWDMARDNTSGAANDAAEPLDVRINELHYDNTGSDVGEFIEVRVEAGGDASGLIVELYNGNGGGVYNTLTVSDGTMTSDGTYDYYVINLPSNGLQNGSPDGLALSNNGELVEFLSYEGTLTGVGGAADGVTSTDIGVSEPSDTPIDFSLQRLDGDIWDAPRENTSGASNALVVPTDGRINEIHYDNDGADVGEFVEIRVNAGADVSELSVELYNGNGGTVYNTLAVSSGTMTSDGTYDYYVLEASLQNGSPDGLALVEGDSVVEFLSYEGTLDATDGSAIGLTSTDIGVAETGSTQAGFSLQRLEGDTWDEARENTSGESNIVAGVTLISTIQGSTDISPVEGQIFTVSAIVTELTGNGFFIQEELVDYDADDSTSEGLFVFTGGAYTVTVGDLVEATGTVDEFFGSTQLTSVTSVEVLSSGNPLPDFATLTLPFTETTNLEAYESMRVEVTTSNGEALTVIENFNLDRFGEITISAGNQVQPTQIYDPQTEAAEIEALSEANALNRLLIDDGVSSQNPTSFEYIPETGDNVNGNGFLDVGDTFDASGPTLRLGAELDAPATGILTYQFGDYTLLADRLSIDETTNTGARQEAPSDVGGTFQVASFNVLNLFNNIVDGRGARSEEDLTRQLDKLVNAMLASGAEVFGLQELENDGFGEDSTIQLLVDALNAAAGAEIYAFVDPTTDGAPIGTDEITNGIIYNTQVLELSGSAFYVFDEASADATEAASGNTYDQLNRPVIAATFVEIASGEAFTLAVNHFKSKGSSGLSGLDPMLDPNIDQGDGQGFWNQARLDAAIELSAWLATDPTGSGDPDYLIIGDLNSYAMEDPIQALIDAGYTDLAQAFIGSDAYSFVFSGQRGTLDYGLANDSFLAQITGVTEWHINADEPDLLNYNSRFNDAGFYGDDVFAASDHDPLIIGVDLGGSETATAESTKSSPATSSTVKIQMVEAEIDEIDMSFVPTEFDFWDLA